MTFSNSSSQDIIFTFTLQHFRRNEVPLRTTFSIRPLSLLSIWCLVCWVPIAPRMICPSHATLFTLINHTLNLYPPQTWPQPWHGPSILFTLMSPQSWIFHTSSMLSLVHRTLNMIPLSCLPWYPPQTDESDTSLLLTYRMFIKYCVFSEVFKNIPDSSLSLFSLGVSVYAHQTDRKPALQQNWQSSEKSHFKKKHNI